MPSGPACGKGTSYSEMAPCVSMRPMRFPNFSANQIAPSAPTAQPNGPLSGFGSSNSSNPCVSGSNRPIRLPPFSQNQTAPSGPSTQIYGWLPTVGIRCSLMRHPAKTRLFTA